MVAGFVGIRFLHLPERMTQLLEWVRTLGPQAPLYFVGLYILASVLSIPCFPLTVGAGALFGPVWGTVWVSLGSSLGSSASFLISRFVAREWVKRRFAGSRQFQALDQAVGREGAKIVALTRLSPVFPYVLLNYLYGVTRVSGRDFFFATWIGMLPSTILYVYLGSLAGDLSQLNHRQHRTPVEWAFLGLGLILTGLIMRYLTQVAKATLATRLPEPPN